MAFRYDLVLKGGEVIDPGQGLRGVRDVAFHDGKVAAIAPEIPKEDARDAVEVSSKLVTPGLIDIHGHYFEHVVPFGTAADAVCLPNGVTTTVDAGSSGWMQFEAFKEYIIRGEKMYTTNNTCDDGQRRQTLGPKHRMTRPPPVPYRQRRGPRLHDERRVLAS